MPPPFIKFSINWFKKMDLCRFSVSAIIVGCSRMTASEVVVNGSGSKTDSESADRPAGKRLSVSSHSPPSSKKRKNSDS